MDKISDMLTTIRNGYMAKKEAVIVRHTKRNEAIAKKLAKLGFVENVSVKKEAKQTDLHIELKYDGGDPVLTHVKRISKPGLRIYSPRKNLKPPLSGFGYTLVSTSKGIMTNKEAQNKGVGGEIICEVW